MKKQQKQNVISNCTFTSEAFKVDEHYAAAIRALAEAASCNALAIKQIAERLAGPVDNRVALKVGE